MFHGNHPLRWLALLGWLLTGAALAGTPGDPGEVIQTTADRLHQVLRQTPGDARDPARAYRLADEILMPHVDMERVSSLVLGRYWRSASADQKQAFATTFKRLLVRTYATALQELGDWEMRFLPVQLQPGGEQALVQTQLLRAGAPPMAVDYSMHRRDGRWLAYDLRIEGISLVTNYRSSFARLIQSKGIAGLIAELQARENTRTAGAGQTLAQHTRP
jgi:phospholipid transport system substrate-binding protein